jgi:hypothetical protein
MVARKVRRSKMTAEVLLVPRELCARDPSLRLKNGSAQDDAFVRVELRTHRFPLLQ